VLAEVGEGDEPPTIESNPDVPGGLRLDYRSGRFFIRDDWGRLRCLRQKKTADVPWPALAIPPDEVHPAGMVLGGGNKLGEKNGRLYGRRNGGWQFVASGWEGELAEYVLRMYCLEVGAFRFGARSDRGGVTYTVGEQLHSVQSSTLSDDGELFVAVRMHEWLVNRHRDQFKKVLDNRKKLVGAETPAIFAAKWLNGDAIALDDLKGKPALVYFAGQYSKRIADQLTSIDELYGKYEGRGLEVVAVIPDDDEEVYAAICEKRGWRFPLAIDPRGGPAAQRFSVTDTPSYFLISRDGKVAEGLYSERIALLGSKRPPPLPDAEEIERLLGAAAKE
ncbi:MAG TPA: TlpA disulfide reductase family protein, partial [Pirellulales bacterium]|nr:TlpA disulfide reductase family protein [Pirellulales bacterium]